MNKLFYYLLTQGTKSSDYSFILKNGNVIGPTDDFRTEILEKFQQIDEKSSPIHRNDPRITIKKFKSNYLIEVLTTNVDRKGRKIPVELLLENYLKSHSLKKDLGEIRSILKSENIILDENLWLSLPSLLERINEKYYRKKRIKNVIIVFAVAVSLFLLILILLK